MTNAVPICICYCNMIIRANVLKLFLNIFEVAFFYLPLMQNPKNIYKIYILSTIFTIMSVPFFLYFSLVENQMLLPLGLIFLNLYVKHKIGHIFYKYSTRHYLLSRIFDRHDENLKHYLKTTNQFPELTTVKMWPV